MTITFTRDGMPVYDDWNEVPVGFVSPAVAYDLNLGSTRNERPIAYFNDGYGYGLLYDRRNHSRLKLPKYIVKWDIENGYVYPKDRPFHFFTHEECQIFNCKETDEEEPIACLEFQTKGKIDKYALLYDRSDYLDSLEFYQNVNDVPKKFLSFWACKHYSFPVKIDEKPIAYSQLKNEFIAFYDREKQVRLRNLFKK